ncbi:MAG: hypothetical protein GF411_19100 [Candidatus Lokiarchaeota archaeon]|nr:hypothetical protein [Candidatus Lokiarchaeota archaeon]
MLSIADKIEGYSILTEDGDIGEVVSLLFDDRDWSVQYLVVDVGNLVEEKVLISTEIADVPIWKKETIPVKVSKQKIKDSPTINLSGPVSEERLTEIHRYYGWAPFRPGILPSSPTTVPGAAMPISSTITYEIVDESRTEEHVSKEAERHLRSINEVNGYYVEATDESVGNIENFLLDADEWVIRYAVVDVGGWLSEEKRLVANNWIEDVDWLGQKISMKISKNRLEKAPHFDKEKQIDREYEAELFEIYDQPGYWL